MFSDKIRELMIERDISLTDLAELSGVPFETLRNIYYRKVKDPKVSTAFQLASALEVTVEYLLKDMSTTEEEAENSEGQERKNFLKIIESVGIMERQLFV